MANPEIANFGFVFITLAAFGALGVLFSRRQANRGNVLIILLLPPLYLFLQPLLHGEMPQSLQEVSGSLIVGVIASLIAGAILLVVKRK